jgi:hypothetical protein
MVYPRNRLSGGEKDATGMVYPPKDRNGGQMLMCRLEKLFRWLVLVKISVLLSVFELFWFAIHDQMALTIKHLDHGKGFYLSQCNYSFGIRCRESVSAHCVFCLYVLW